MIYSFIHSTSIYGAPSVYELLLYAMGTQKLKKKVPILMELMYSLLRIYGWARACVCVLGVAEEGPLEDRKIVLKLSKSQ